MSPEGKVAIMAHRLGLEAAAWEEMAEVLAFEGATSARDACRARAASLADFVRDLLSPQDRAAAVLSPEDAEIGGRR